MSAIVNIVLTRMTYASSSPNGDLIISYAPGSRTYLDVHIPLLAHIGHSKSSTVILSSAKARDRTYIILGPAPFINDHQNPIFPIPFLQERRNSPLTPPSEYFFLIKSMRQDQSSSRLEPFL
jgi:hypothetical protein